MNLYYDSEFTGLTQNTSLISLGLVSDDGHSFYAEFSDYNTSQIDDWLRDNVLAHCQWIASATAPFHRQQGQQTEAFGDRGFIVPHLESWLSGFKGPEKLTLWADCYAWDWVLFAGLFGGAFGLPPHIHYMPGDLATLFRAKGLDPDTDREAFAGLHSGAGTQAKHNALWDAQVIKACYRKLMALPNSQHS